MLLYYITDRTQFPGDEPERRERLLHKIAEATRSGIDYVQLREKDLGGRELEQLAREAMQRVSEYGTKTRLLINSRTDIALTVGADGIHLRSQDLSPEDVRKIWDTANPLNKPIIAVSCHTEAEVAAAEKSGAAFVVFGPVYGKQEPSYTQAADLERLRAASRSAIPVLALGGITLTNAASCIRAGAKGVAGIRLFQESKIRDVVEALGP